MTGRLVLVWLAGNDQWSDGAAKATTNRMNQAKQPASSEERYCTSDTQYAQYCIPTHIEKK